MRQAKAQTREFQAASEFEALPDAVKERIYQEIDRADTGDLLADRRCRALTTFPPEGNNKATDRVRRRLDAGTLSSIDAYLLDPRQACHTFWIGIRRRDSCRSFFEHVVCRSPDNHTTRGTWPRYWMGR
jgi:hypothetical protein